MQVIFMKCQQTNVTFNPNSLKRAYIDKGHSLAALVIGQAYTFRAINHAIGTNISFLTQWMAIVSIWGFTLVILIESVTDVISATSICDNKLIARCPLAAVQVPIWFRFVNAHTSTFIIQVIWADCTQR
jgi:hypothetical protein